MKNSESKWNLYDKIIIVEKPLFVWQNGKYTKTDLLQGYVVEYGNKKTLESAITWGTHYENNVETGPTQQEFDNNGFTLSIYDSANCSSQGGKLSFMNCLIEKDGHEWLIGINSDILVDLIKTSTFVNGKCQEKICFGRKHSQVGAIAENSEIYNEAKADMALRENAKKAKKTSKWIPGHSYSTLTQKCTYLGEVYLWYERKYDSNYKNTTSLTTHRQLEKPIRSYLIKEENTSCTGRKYTIFDRLSKLPSRIDDGEVMTKEDAHEELNKWIDAHNEEMFDPSRRYYYDNYGYSDSESNRFTYHPTDEQNNRLKKNDCHILNLAF